MSVDQLRHAGFGTAQVDAMVRVGALVAVHDGVYRTATTVMSTRRLLLAGCLAVGGVVATSHRAALWLWDLVPSGRVGSPCDAPPLELTTPATHRPVPRDCVVHLRTDLRPGDVTVHRGVPVTTPARTLADAGSVVDRSVLGTAVDKALYLRLVTLRDLAHQCAAVPRRAAHPGVAALRGILVHRLPRR